MTQLMAIISTFTKDNQVKEARLVEQAVNLEKEINDKKNDEEMS